MKNNELKKQCKFCKSEIDYNARICPFCRKKQKKSILLIVIGVILFLGIIGAIFGDDETETLETSHNDTNVSTKKETTKTTKNKQKKIEYMKIDPEELITDYEANEVKGDEIYDGKYMELTGKVDSIGKDLLEKVYITFERENEFEFTSVQCYFDDKEEIKKVMDLSKGDKVTVQGKCTGKFGNVSIEKCKLK